LPFSAKVGVLAQMEKRKGEEVGITSSPNNIFINKSG